jgi:hypothetical protein
MRPDLAGLEYPAPRWWHCQHDTSSDRTPLARMLRGSLAVPPAAMAGFGESCRDSGHGFSSLFDPEPTFNAVPDCKYRGYNSADPFRLT